MGHFSTFLKVLVSKGFEFHNTAFIYVIFGPGSFCVFYLLQKSTLSLYLRVFSVSHKLVMIKT